MDGKRKEVGRKATALDGLPIKQHYLRVFDDEWEKPLPHQRGGSRPAGQCQPVFLVFPAQAGVIFVGPNN